MVRNFYEMLRSIAASKLCKIYVGICSFSLVQWSMVSCQPLVKRISRKLRNDCHSIFSRTQKKYEACFNKTSPPPSTQKCHALTRTKGYIICHLINMRRASNGSEPVEQNDLRLYKLWFLLYQASARKKQLEISNSFSW